MPKLDESRHSSICGMGTGHFYRQDGKLFDLVTKEEVDPTKIPKSTEEMSLICKFCGAKRGTAEMMHEHLAAKHGAQIKSANKPKEEAETETVPKATSEEKAKTEPEAKPEAEAAEEKDKPEAEAKAEAEEKKIVTPKSKGKPGRPKKETENAK